MGILTTKILRDIRYNKGRSFSIVFIIMMAAALYSGLLLAYEGVGYTFNQIEEDLNSHDARFILNNYTDPGSLDMAQFDTIKAWDSRASLLSGVKLSGNDKIFTSVIYGIVAGRSPRVDNYDLLGGNELSDANATELLMTQTFMNSQNLELNDSLQLFVGTQKVNFTIKGMVFSNEFIYSVNPVTGLPDVQGMAPIWIPLQKAKDLFGISGVNEVVVRFKDSPGTSAEINQIKEYLGSVAGAASSVTWDQEGDQQMKEGDLGALDDFARVFGGIIFMIALFAIYDNVSKLIANQRNYIGTMRALGGSKWKVTNHYTSLASSLGLVGIILGGPTGYFLADVLIQEYAGLLGIPEPKIHFVWSPFIETFLLMGSLTLVLSFLTSLRASQINPREAMSSSFISQVFTSKPILERIVNKIPGFKSPSETIAIRTIFRNRRKTLLTIFTYAISTLLIISALGFMDSFFNAIDQNYANYQTYDLEVYLENPMNATALNSVLDSMPEITIAEPFISETIDVQHNGMAKSTAIFGFIHDSQLRHFNIGKDQSDKLILGSLLADELDVGINEQVQFLGHSFDVTGIASELVSESVYMDLADAQQLLNSSGYFNGVIMDLKSNVKESEVKQMLQNNLPVATIISTQDVQDSINVLMQGVLAMIAAMVLIGFLISALFSFNTIVLEVISRENEFVNLRSLGANRWKIAKIILIQSLVISVVGSIVAIPLGYWVTSVATTQMVQGLMVIPVYISLRTYALGILTAFVATLVGIYAGYRHIMNIDMVEALRTRVSN